MKNSGSHKPMSARKRAAVLANLSKARAAARSPASYARSRHHATKHGLFVQQLANSFQRLAEDPREFAKLHALLKRMFSPRDVTEQTLVRRLAEAVWRHARVYRAMARFELAQIEKIVGQFPELPLVNGEETRQRAYWVMMRLFNKGGLYRRATTLVGEVERMLRLLLVHRTGDPRTKFRSVGRRNCLEITELSADPKQWARRYAASVPLKKQVSGAGDQGLGI